MKRLLLALLVSIISLSNISCKAQDNIGWFGSEYTTINYGYLYNWYAAIDARKITSSDDFVLPTQTHINTLVTYLGGSSVAGGKLKELGTTYWNSPNTEATNEFGFNFRGSGCRQQAGTSSLIKEAGYFRCDWLSGGSPVVFIAQYNSSTSVTGLSDAKRGYPIRLLYVGSGTPTSYTGNDGKMYRVVKIGTQYWLADNLAETKYRDGSTIPVVTDNTTWAALITGARCVYNNDESNK